MLNGVRIKISRETGKALSINRIFVREAEGALENGGADSEDAEPDAM